MLLVKFRNVQVCWFATHTSRGKAQGYSEDFIGSIKARLALLPP